MTTTIRDLTNGILEYNTITTYLFYSGENTLRVLANFNGIPQDKPENLVYDYHTTLGSSSITVKSLGKTFDIFSGDTLEQVNNKLGNYLLNRTSYTAKGKKPIDVYGIFNKLMPLVKQKRKFMIKIFDLPQERVPQGFTPLLSIAGSVVDSPPFLFEIAVSGGVPYLRLHNSSLGTHCNDVEYLEIKVNELVPLLLRHYGLGVNLV